MKVGDRTGFEGGKFLFVDQVIADQAMAGSVAKFDIERKRLEQVVAFERGEEVGDRPIALIEFVETGDYPLEVRRRPAMLVEHSKPLLARFGDALVREVDVNLGRPLALCAADQERLDRERQRSIPRVPLATLDEQIFTILEPEQDERRKASAVDVSPEQDRKFVLHPAELAWHRQAR